MAVFTPLFTQVVEADFTSDTETFFGSGTLPPFSTLIVHCGRTETDTGTASTFDVGSVDGQEAIRVRNQAGINSGLAVACAIFYYKNETPVSIDLTNNVGVAPLATDIGVVGQSVFIAQAFVVDTLISYATGASGSFVSTSVNLVETTVQAGQYMLGVAVVPGDPATFSYSNNRAAYPTTYYDYEGIAPNPGGANLGITLRSMDWFGVTPGTSCSIDGIPQPPGTNNGVAAYAVWEEDTFTIQQLPVSEITFQLKNRPALAVTTPVGTSLWQRYELGLLYSVLEQPYSTILGKELVQNYESLKSISKSQLAVNYNLGVVDVQAELVQEYGMSVRSQLAQDYSSLTQVYSSIEQPYTSTTPVANDFTSTYDLSSTTTVYKSLVSHYSSYDFSNVIIITSPPGLTYKPGYTIEPDT